MVELNQDRVKTGFELDNVTCAYGKVTVLESLSLAALPGELLCLLGPNGAGKTTLLRAWARFLRPAGGTVLLDGRDIWQLPREYFARQVALTPQTERRDWPLTVEQSVSLGRAPHRGWVLPLSSADREVVERALESAGLSSLRERPITQLSGGEWRRMIIARALAQEARVLLLDEPTAGLDLKYQVQMLQLVRDLARREQLTVVLTLHDLNHAALYSDRIALLGESTLLALGEPASVMTPELIEETFGVPVTVVQHPIYGTPLVVPALQQPAGGATEDSAERST